MDFEVHCKFILPTELSLFNYDKVKSVLQSVTPLSTLNFNNLKTLKVICEKSNSTLEQFRLNQVKFERCF